MVVGVDAEPGSVLAVGASVVRLAFDGPRDAVFTVPEDSLPAMRSLQGRAGALKVRPWGTQTLLPATVREVAAAADPVTRTFLVKAQPIQVAGADGNTLVVSSGLSAGQTVVTAGVHVLTPGQKVKLYEPVALAKP